MKPIAAASSLLGVALLASACASKVTAVGIPRTGPLTTASEASERIVWERCERQRRCAPPNTSQLAAHACTIEQKDEVEKNFADNPHCGAGVDIAELDSCIVGIRSEGCDAENLTTSYACRSRNLCIH